MKSSRFLLPFCVAGMLAAQTPATPQSAPASHARRAKTGMVQRLSARLSLTPDQQIKLEQQLAAVIRRLFID